MTLSDGLDQVGNINWQLALCLVLTWIVIYICVCKGVKSSGKVTRVCVFHSIITTYLNSWTEFLGGVTQYRCKS